MGTVTQTLYTIFESGFIDTKKTSPYQMFFVRLARDTSDIVSTRRDAIDLFVFPMCPNVHTGCVIPKAYLEGGFGGSNLPRNLFLSINHDV